MLPCHFASLSHKIFAFELERLVAGNHCDDCDPEAVADASACELGKWIDGHAQTLSQVPHFHELHAMHRRFHLVAGDMAAKFKHGDIAGAREIATTTFKTASDAILGAIAMMEREMERRQ